LYYSLTFIKEVAPFMNQYYKFIMYSRRIQQWWKKIIYKPHNIGYKRSQYNFYKCIIHYK